MDMKRDLGLIHKILQYAEQQSPGGSFDIEIENVPQPKLDYHVKLCIQAGFLEPSVNGEYWTAGLTWTGHDALKKLNKGCSIEAIADCTP